MEFTERLTALAYKVAQQKASLETEEATKNAFVMPFISTILKYDVFDKSIARLHFNTGQKYIGLFDEEKKETRHPIDALEDIFQYSDELRAAVERFTGTLAA